MPHPSNHNTSNCNASIFKKALLLFALYVGTFFIAGCSSTESEQKTARTRGWIGGEFRETRRPMGTNVWLNGIAAPNPLTNAPKHGLLITALATNTPARVAGLREGDLILELNHEPVHRLTDFRRVLDDSMPGTNVLLKVYQNGEVAEHMVTVGRETYEKYGIFAVGLPFYSIKNLDLWPNPTFSLIFMGYDESRGQRPELGSVDSIYQRHRDASGKYEPSEETSRFWLVLFGVSRGTKTISQEIVPATASAANGGRTSFAASLHRR